MCQTTSLLLFTLGGALAVYHREYWEAFRGSYFHAGRYLVLFLVFAAFRWLSLPVLSTISVIVSPILFWKSCDLLTRFKLFDREPLWFCKQSFFLYAAHDFPVETLSAILSRASNNMAWIAISYIVTPLVVLACLYIAARFLSRRLPKVYQLLCGGRTSSCPSRSPSSSE